jgi:putative DNA primase/helicase
MAFSMNFAQVLAQLEATKLAENHVIENPLSEFETTLKAFGLEPVHIEVNGIGNFKRIASNVGGSRSKDSGWYWLEQDGDSMYGCYGDWRTGESQSWQSTNMKRLSPDERIALDKRIADAKNLHKQKLAETRDKAAERSVATIASMPDAKDTFPYLKKKGVVAHEGVKTDGKYIYIPVYIGGKLRSIQSIDKDGNKQFAWESETKGGYFWIAGKTSTDIFFAEGYATGATIHEATGASVMVCFNAANLYNVVANFRAGNKETPATIAADNDYHNNNKPCGNVGLDYAEKCVDNFDGIKMIFPEGIKGTDFNDMQNEKGIEHVKRIANHYIPRFNILDGNKLEVTATDWLIDNYLPKSNLGLVYGASGHMKSFLVFDWALHLAAGMDWHGNEVKEAQPVLYICGEGFNSIAKRVKAWKSHKNITHDIPFSLTDKAVHILDPTQRIDLVSDLLYSMAKNGQENPPKLIIIDTLNRNFGDGDENSTQDMTNFIIGIDELHRKTGAMILIVHHSGKGEVKTARGSSALRASLDMEYEVTMLNPEEFESRQQPAHIELKCTKMKDDEPPEIKVFEHKSIVVPDALDRKGDPVTSVVLMPLNVTTKEMKLESFLSKQINIDGSSKTEFAVLALKEAFIDVATGVCKTTSTRAGMMFVVNRRDINDRFNYICKKHDIDISTMRSLKQRAFTTLHEMNFIDETDGTTPMITTKSNVVLAEINARAAK